ncbi:nuclear transport factor 2 family protein [Pseudoalteromonas sp. MMG010]|uniref:nuclear transport factor 2 family protein n=1 Tax=Pseudoalteromonas sp. MMG010 TaxID=2822685 RepID=UPI001B39DB18|nr:nuclear transport factor 2 family protein [Pseudoalteromonas sp. MMG010]MBQ4833735.1 nuclear transport factor 2 family protein [Pseudoalteromonas sp. MMG010]
MSSKIKVSLFTHLIDAERQLLEPEVRQSVALLDALLDDEFIEIAGNGTVFNKHQVITRLPNEIVPQFYNQGFKGRMLSDDVAQLSYQAAYRRSARAEFQYSLRMSLWRKQGEKWKMVFHQGTPCPQFTILMDDE